MKHLATYMSLLLVAGTVSGCSSLSGFSTPSQKSTTTKTSDKKKNAESKRKHQESDKDFAAEQARLSKEVLSGRWTIHTVNSKNVTGDDDQWPYIEFDVTTNKFYASNGCNLINGRFDVTPDQRMTLSHILASRHQQCPESEYPAINTTLPQVDSYSLEKRDNEYYLNLHNANHITVMVLRKHNMEYLNGPWQVTEIHGQKCQNQDIRLVIDIPERRLHGNTGCNIMNGSLAEDPVKNHSIQFHNIITTRSKCADEAAQATETALLIALEDVEYAATGSHGTVKLLDKRHRIVLRLKPIDSGQ